MEIWLLLCIGGLLKRGQGSLKRLGADIREVRSDFHEKYMAVSLHRGSLLWASIQKSPGIWGLEDGP